MFPRKRDSTGRNFIALTLGARIRKFLDSSDAKGCEWRSVTPHWSSDKKKRMAAIGQKRQEWGTIARVRVFKRCHGDGERKRVQERFVNEFFFLSLHLTRRGTWTGSLGSCERRRRRFSRNVIYRSALSARRRAMANIMRRTRCSIP